MKTKTAPFWVGLLMVLTTPITAENRHPHANRPGHKPLVSGHVVSADAHQPVAFATIVVKGSNHYALSNDAGHFELTAAPTDTLVVQSLGYEPRETTGNASPLRIVLSPLTYSTNEVTVVATALGIKRAPRELGSATETLSDKQLNEGNPVNPLTGLTGRVAGLRVNMYDSKVDPNIQVTMRGARSITGNNAPLYVVDGIPVPDINRLNPHDIESITVLKGANAAALYGSEGVNGALIITTKSGAGKGTITLRQSTTFSQVYLLPKAQNQFGQGADGTYSPTEYQSWGPAFDGSMRDFGTVLPNGTQPQVRYAAPANDVRKELFQTGTNLLNDLSFSKKTNQGSYFLSLQNVSIRGIIPDDQSTRNGMRFNTVQEMGKLRIATHVNYSYTTTQTTPDGPWVSMYKMPANFPLAEMKNWQHKEGWGNPENFFTTAVKNPFYLIDSYRNTTQQQLINGKAEFEYSLTPWLKALYRLGLYSTQTQTHHTVARYDSDRAGNSLQGSVSDGASNYRRLNGDLVVTANRQFGSWRISGVVGQNFRDDYTKSTNLLANNLLFDNLFNPGSSTDNLSGSAGIYLERQLALYGELTAGYNNYLFATLTGRNDWTSVLHPNHRSYFYPGVSTSFVFTDAIALLNESATLSFGKVYASYNKTGNVNLSPYSLNLIYTQTGGFPYNGLPGFVPASKNPNPNLKPEFVHSFETGIQLSLFDRRLQADAAYIYSNSEGQIFTATSSAATGYTSTVVNLGALENNIWELTLDGDLVRTPDIRWNLGVHYAYIQNTVKDLYGSGEAEEYNIFRQSYAIKGQAYPSLKVTDYVRDPQGRIVVDGTTGLPSAATEPTYKGTLVPPHQLGLQTTLRYKNLTLYADFDCRLGGWMYSEVANAMIQTGTHPMTVAHQRGEFVIPNSVIAQTDAQGHTTYVPNTSVVAQGSNQAAYWNKYVAGYSVNYAAPGDYLKMRTLSVKYTVGKQALSKLKIASELAVSAEATNLFLIRHRANDFGDPEYLYNNTAGYYSWRQVPPYRTFGFSIQAIF